MPRWGIFFFEYTIYGRLNAQYEYGSRLMNESQRTMTTNDGTKLNTSLVESASAGHWV
jgi:hypothetical protein